MQSLKVSYNPIKPATNLSQPENWQLRSPGLLPTQQQQLAAQLLLLRASRHAAGIEHACPLASTGRFLRYVLHHCLSNRQTRLRLIQRRPSQRPIRVPGQWLKRQRGLRLLARLAGTLCLTLLCPPAG